MEADVAGLIGAGRHERSADRLNYRKGYRDRSLETRLGTLSLRSPKLRQGSYIPPFLDPRKTAEPAAELPGVAVTCEGEITLFGPAGSRTVRASDFPPGPCRRSANRTRSSPSCTCRNGRAAGAGPSENMPDVTAISPSPASFCFMTRIGRGR